MYGCCMATSSNQPAPKMHAQLHPCQLYDSCSHPRTVLFTGFREYRSGTAIPKLIPNPIPMHLSAPSSRNCVQTAVAAQLHAEASQTARADGAHFVRRQHPPDLLAAYDAQEEELCAAQLPRLLCMRPGSMPRLAKSQPRLRAAHSSLPCQLLRSWQAGSGGDGDDDPLACHGSAV
jgi:hypothetical protein